jgi:hypothetical protein
LLYIPPAWWHWVFARSVSASLSLTGFPLEGTKIAWEASSVAPLVGLQPPVRERAGMLSLEGLSRDFVHALRAFAAAGLDDALQARMSSSPITSPDDALDAFLSVAQDAGLAESYADVARFCHARSWVSGQPIREAPHAVDRLTPFVRVPHRAVRCSVPIHLYVAGDVDDPAALTPGPTTYLVVRDPDMPLQTEALEVQSAVFLDALLSSEPLEAMLARSPHVAQWMRWLADLGEARFLLWLLPR